MTKRTTTLSANPELLAPAGGPAPFAAALAAGADAIYCGMGSFNARRKADNFDDKTFAAACRAAHLAGARVYVTVNIVIKQDEMPEALALVRRCSVLGADAFIIQDWGLFAEIRRQMPQVETHISTQANIHDDRGARFCEELGADRVTLSRELSLAEIRQIGDATDVDLEVFAHGAICFCYSGVCLLSSFARAGRSANRGMCAQPCRLPYELIDEHGRNLSPADRERPLCPRDTNTSELVEQMIDAGAGALKLEGRMKAPDYVYSVVDAYRGAIDEALAKHGTSPSAADAAAKGNAAEIRQRQLKRAFNRDFTHAYQDGTSGDEMMSYERSNNRGQMVGEVVSCRAAGGNLTGLKPDDRRRRVAVARVRLDEPVGAGDLLELRHDDEFDQFLTCPAPDNAPAGSVIECKIPRAMPAGSRVRIIRSQAAIDAADAVAKRAWARKRPVNVCVTARIGEPFSVSLSCADDPNVAATVTGFTVEAARTRPVSREDLREHVGRMGTTPFDPVRFDIELDEGAGMGFSAVHRVRQEACDALEAVILAPFDKRGRVIGSIAIEPPAAECRRSTPSPVLCARAITREQVAIAQAARVKRVYMSTEHLEEEGISPDEARELGIIASLDEVCRLGDHARLDPWVYKGGSVAVGNISELARAHECGCSAEIRSCIPVHNSATLRFLTDAGAHGAWLSPEMSLAEIEQLAAATCETLGVTVYGRPRVMTSEHCILQVASACIHDCARCRMRTRALSLKNIDGRMFPVRTDLNGRSRLFASEIVDITPQIPQMLSAGVSRFLVDGAGVGPDEFSRALEHTRRAIRAALDGRTPQKRASGTTAGCLFVGVE